MSTFGQFSGQRATRSIITAQSSGTPIGVTASGGRRILSGALTAGTLKTLVSIAGAGEISVLYVATMNVTSRTLRLRLTIDGVVVFDSTSAAIAASGAGIVAIGGQPTGSEISAGLPARFNISAVVEVASSLSETDNVVIGYVAHTF